MVLESGLLQEQDEQLCADRAPAPAGHSRHAARLAHGAARPPGGGEGPGATRGDPGARVSLCAAAGRGPVGGRDVAAGTAPVGGGGVPVPAGVPPQATYTFKHALIQDVAYQSLLRSTRQQYHQRIAQALEAQFPETVETQPELVAQHYTAAGCAEQAVPYWLRAGQQASDRSAYLEAISHVTSGIALLKTLPETPEHTQQALTLYLALGAALHCNQRARSARGGAGLHPGLRVVSAGGRNVTAGPGPVGPVAILCLTATVAHGARARRNPAAPGATYPRPGARGHRPHALGATRLCLGALPAARAHLEEGRARYTPDQHRTLVFRMGQDPGVACRLYVAATLWLLGYPAQALARLHEALTLAHALSHPFSLACARCWAAFVSQFRRDVSAVHEHAEAAVALATEQGFPHLGGPGNNLTWVGADHAGPG